LVFDGEIFNKLASVREPEWFHVQGPGATTVAGRSITHDLLSEEANVTARNDQKEVRTVGKLLDQPVYKRTDFWITTCYELKFVKDQVGLIVTNYLFESGKDSSPGTEGLGRVVSSSREGCYLAGDICQVIDCGATGRFVENASSVLGPVGQKAALSHPSAPVENQVLASTGCPALIEHRDFVFSIYEH
jgi:hypothetical protein